MRSNANRGSVVPSQESAGGTSSLVNRQHDLPELLASSEVLVRLARLLNREDAVHDRLEAAHEDELHDLLELPLVRHRGPEDGELAPEQVAGVELEHRAARGARDDDPATFPQGSDRGFERGLPDVVDNHVDPALARR